MTYLTRSDYVRNKMSRMASHEGCLCPSKFLTSVRVNLFVLLQRAVLSWTPWPTLFLAISCTSDERSSTRRTKTGKRTVPMILGGCTLSLLRLGLGFGEWCYSFTIITAILNSEAACHRGVYKSNERSRRFATDSGLH